VHYQPVAGDVRRTTVLSIHGLDDGSTPREQGESDCECSYELDGGLMT